jgi:gamma-glutamyl hercynylcysteine S-oxide synthase
VDPRLEIRSALERVRMDTEELLAPLSDEELAARPSPPRSPLVWDLAGLAHFEELWLVRTLEERPPLSAPHDAVYEALHLERRGSSKLPVLRPAAVRAYAADVREHVLGVLERVDLEDGAPLVRNGFVFGLVLQHELRQQEKMLETIACRPGGEYPLPDETPPERAPAGPAEIEIPGGAFVLGAVEEPWAYDNELVPHEVELAPFLLDRAPVSNAGLAEFVADGGYDAEKLWSRDGWAWRWENQVWAPIDWELQDGDWVRTRFGRREQVPPHEPVQHVSFFEVDAYARWAGKRLPTEAEWERAAGWDVRSGKNRFPWGREAMGYEANLGRRMFSPAPVGSYPGGESAAGCLQMAGDVWEWTSSFFQPYPGFVAFPDAESSEAFFGERYRVLRGGSWATDPVLARTTFRNPQHPAARRVFAGFRCARDA